jgi:hypothetical protein
LTDAIGGAIGLHPTPGFVAYVVFDFETIGSKGMTSLQYRLTDAQLTLGRRTETGARVRLTGGAPKTCLNRPGFGSAVVFNWAVVITLRNNKVDLPRRPSPRSGRPLEMQFGELMGAGQCRREVIG